MHCVVYMCAYYISSILYTNLYTSFIYTTVHITYTGKSDQDKYGTAIQLKGCIEEVRNNYTANLDSEVSVSRLLYVYHIPYAYVRV